MNCKRARNLLASSDCTKRAVAPTLFRVFAFDSTDQAGGAPREEPQEVKPGLSKVFGAMTFGAMTGFSPYRFQVSERTLGSPLPETNGQWDPTDSGILLFAKFAKSLIATGMAVKGRGLSRGMEWTAFVW